MINKLDETIVDVSYVLGCLLAFRNICESGDCNNCKVSNACEVKPKAGQMVRYNCPFYVKDGRGRDEVD